MLTMLLVCLCGMSQVPKPIGPLPTPAQVEWQQLETYAFIHFGPNTFTDKEWGYGDAPASCFNPTQLDCDQWARILKQAGMKGVIITAKHHDGFCLWPTKYTDYSVRNSPWRGGQGDVLRELAEACSRHGLQLGFYLSPWDRHQAFYGTSLYPDYYYAQMEELVTQYGPLFEIWLDGANGGDGWYGGACEERKIDKRTYYHFDRVLELVKNKQPEAIVFSDGGPGCRWIGNERGEVGQTNWSFLRGKEVYPGYEKAWELNNGHADGDTWIAAECDVSIRPGWFYHASEDDKVKTAEQLMDIYYTSVGRNGNFLLNVPVNAEGLISEVDSARLMAFRSLLTKEFAHNVMRGAKVKASSERGKTMKAMQTLDGQYATYWAASDNDATPSLTFTLPKATRLNTLLMQEFIPLGQRIKAFEIAYEDHGAWIPVEAQEQTTTVGYKRIVRFKPLTAKKLRITFIGTRACPCISTVEAYLTSQGKAGKR